MEKSEIFQDFELSPVLTWADGPWPLVTLESRVWTDD